MWARGRFAERTATSGEPAVGTGGVHVVVRGGVDGVGHGDDDGRSTCVVVLGAVMIGCARGARWCVCWVAGRGCIVVGVRRVAGRAGRLGDGVSECVDAIISLGGAAGCTRR